MGREANSSDVAATRPGLESSAGVQRLLSHFRPRMGLRMSPAELRAEAIVAGAFLLVALPLAVLQPGGGSRPAAVVLLFAALYAVMARIEFDVGSGYGMPTQLVLIPMLYAVGPGFVPLLVAAGLTLGVLPQIFKGKRYPDRAVMAFADAWHAVGPVVCPLDDAEVVRRLHA